ncbi:MAG: LEA type 2 family protein [Polyangiaceae bacterium]|nr:LEA type 2 family protein [Polyangiaceae bacterium]
MTGRALYPAVLAGALLAAGCSKPEMPKITPHSFKLSGGDATGIKLSVELSVENPNSFRISVREVRGKLSVGSGVEVGQAQTASSASVDGKATAIVATDMMVPWSNVSALSSLLASPKVPYTFDGHANLGTDKWNVDVPFKLKGEVDRAELVAAGLRGYKLPSLPFLPTPQ